MRNWMVSGVADETGKLPPPDPNPPVGRPLRKIVDSRPLDGPVQGKKKPWEEEEENDRESN
jgi:hypothetical protein